jgi:hypothetical protein
VPTDSSGGPADRALAAGLVQPDPTTCGSSVLVVARMLTDPAYASFVADGTHALAGVSAAGDPQDRFAREALAMHRSTSRARSVAGRLQVPWPTSLGTQPWALAAELGRSGTSYDVKPILPGQRQAAFRRTATLAASGQAVPLYVGNRWSPRHVVLVLPDPGATEAEVRIYDPASGRRYPITSEDFVAGTLDVAGWHVPWVVVLPSA